ncbi:DUF4136 domain-containing protein [Algoriphagus sp. PAP.12]|uniref:DUF4136 domain-containing protein n=1 Tax=Algoriphagus sp. PAP.12 TaxID=2996678 RepID=UPI00227B2577|nr:DUF4136 domain-containing protein [Algoriphagus sp. PAP.12]
MRAVSILSFLLIGLILASCGSSGPVVVDSDLYSDFNLKNYQSFDFVAVDAENTGKPEFEQNIEYLKEAISKKFIERGLNQTSTSPDLLINLGITVEEKVQTRETSLATDPFMYTGQRNYTWQVQEVPVGTYQEGSLTMHLVDKKINQAVWVGTIDRALPNKAKNTPATIDNAVDLLFKKLDK